MVNERRKEEKKKMRRFEVTLIFVPFEILSTFLPFLFQLFFSISCYSFLWKSFDPDPLENDSIYTFLFQTEFLARFECDYLSVESEG